MPASKLIIDDTNFDQFKGGGPSELCGCLPRKTTYGATPGAAPLRRPVIPREQWPDLISDLDKAKATAWHVWKDTPMGVLFQGQISYCHAFSAAGGVMIKRAAQNLPFVMLSASSVGAPITHYQNQGACIEDDLQQMVDVGVASIDFVPMLTTKKADFKPGWEGDAAKHKVAEWTELKPRDFDEHATALLCADPVCVALQYWGHAILDLCLVDAYPALKATDLNRYGVLFLNSWAASWGDNGCGTRVGSKKFGDSLYVPNQITN